MKILILALLLSFVGVANAQDTILYPSNSYSYGFGSMVSAHGSHLFISIRSGVGEAVYIFNKDGDEWIEETRLVAPDTIDDNCFGCAIAVSNNSIVIGASSDDENGVFSGAAYIFERENGSWLSQG
ncbi:MAG: FG-GAP repeat protein [Bacteroidota bacterium]